MRHSNSVFTYRWVVVAAAFLIMFVGYGAAYSFPSYFSVLQQTFAATRAETSFVFALAGFLYFALGALSGAYADRHGAFWPVFSGMLIIAIGLIAAGTAQSLFQIYLYYSIAIGVGVGISYVPAVTAVQHWFVERRATATGLAVSGIGVGTLFVPPLTTELIDAFGWRASYIYSGGVAGLLGIAAAMVLMRAPDALSESRKADVQAHGISAKEALTSRPFILIYAACLVTGFCLFIPFVHIAVHAQDQGTPIQQAIYLVALIGAGSLVGRFLVGPIADRVHARRTMLGLFTAMIPITMIWLFAPSYLFLAVFCVLFGICYGGFVALAPVLMSDYFGLRAIGQIIGVLYTSVALGALVGPTAAGFVFDQFQSYQIPILSILLLQLVALGLLWAAPSPSQWRRRGVYTIAAG